MDKLQKDEKQGVVYHMKYARLKEHRASVHLGKDKNALGTHSLASGHSNYDWDHVEMVVIEPSRDHWEGVESMIIILRESIMN